NTRGLGCYFSLRTSPISAGRRSGSFYRRLCANLWASRAANLCSGKGIGAFWRSDINTSTNLYFRQGIIVETGLPFLRRDPVTTINLNPWFSHWNYQLLEALFRQIPQSEINDDRFET